jgi:hypothetical protein
MARPAFGVEAGRFAQTGSFMAKVLVLYYSSYGHIETMAGARFQGERVAKAAIKVFG